MAGEIVDARILVGIVGPCSAGKSTLAAALRERGYQVKEIMQEHCAAPEMWKRFTNPDVLIYLDVRPEVAAQREGLAEPSSWWAEEREIRLAHARQHCDILLDTSDLSPDVIVARIVDFLGLWMA